MSEWIEPDIPTVELASPRHWTPQDVKALRRSLGLSQLALAHILGVTRKDVQDWENKGNIPAPVSVFFSIVEKDPSILERHGIAVFRTKEEP